MSLQNFPNNQPKWWKYQRVCAVFGDRDTIDVSNLGCAAGTHFHPTRAEAEELIDADVAEWVLLPINRRDRGVVRMVKKSAALRGLSAKANLFRYLKDDARVAAFGAKLSHRRSGKVLNPLLRLLWKLSFSSTPAVNYEPWAPLKERIGEVHACFLLGGQ